MVVEICPHCFSRYTRMKENTDFVHKCNSGDSTLDNEDVLVVGDWEDYTGSASVQPSIVQTAGLQNELQGTDADILDGAKFVGVTNRGKKKPLYRQRQKLKYIDKS